jgi:5S rRNA maturation endonuclease (ribonuclease M5)
METVRIHDYTDEEYNTLYQICKLPDQGDKKQFRGRTTENDWEVPEKIRVPYFLPELIKSDGDIVFVCEGEKDCETLEKYGLIATTTPFGAQAKWLPQYNQYFSGKNIVILPDNDVAGSKYASTVQKSLHGVAKSIKIVNLPRLEEKEDVTDWLELRDGSKSELLQLVEDAPLYVKRNLFEDAIGTDFPKLQFPERKTLINPFLHEKTITEISGQKGCGKTFFAMLHFIGLTHRHRNHHLTICRHTVVETCPCIYFDGEMPIDLFQKRFNALTLGMKQIADYKIISYDDLIQKGWEKTPNLTNKCCQEELYRQLKNNPQYKVLFLDNISCLFPGLDENNKKEWDNINQWLLRLRRIGVSVVMLHHAGKSITAGSRGTSAREDNIDTHIILEDKRVIADAGAHFKVIYDKARSFYGKDTEPWEMELIPVNENSIQWNEVKPENIGIEKMLVISKMLVDGKKQKNIAETLELSKGSISHYKGRAVKAGYIKKQDGKWVLGEAGKVADMIKRKHEEYED